MKRYIFSLLVSSVAFSQGMTWVEQDNNKLTKEAVEALHLLGIKATHDINEAKELLQHYYEALKDQADALKHDGHHLKHNVVLKTEKGKKISHKKLKKFLKYVDKHIKDITIEKGALAEGTVAIVPASPIKKVNEHLFKLVKKHIGALSKVVIFVQDEKNRQEVEHLFNKKFSHFKNVEYRIAHNAHDMLKECSGTLKKEWEKARYVPRYAIFTHLKASHDNIKDFLGAHNYAGTEFKALPWRKQKKWFNASNAYSHAVVHLRDFAHAVRTRAEGFAGSVQGHVKKLYK